MMLKMEEELSFGVMVAIIMENIEVARSMVAEFTIGLMAPDIPETGNKMKCMDKVNSYGLMVENIKDHLLWE